MGNCVPSVDPVYSLTSEAPTLFKLQQLDNSSACHDYLLSSAIGALHAM